MSSSSTYPIKQIPEKEDSSPGAEGWSADIILISGDKEIRGYYDPRGSIAGGKYFYYTGKSNNPIEDCAKLKTFPTHWRYAS